jgi:hypothetical protein
METIVALEPGSRPPVPRGGDAEQGAQAFVTRLRGAAALFAAAAGAQTAVVREAVPPARHRRSRCRIVLRFAGSPRDPAWLVPDLDAADRVAVDVAAWAAAS